MTKTKSTFDLPKTLCYILRHKPDDFGLTLDAHGYAQLDKLVNAINSKYTEQDVTVEDILKEVERDEKGRYVIKDNTIKCTFGHSIPILIEDSFDIVPTVLYHGTSQKSLKAIQREGLAPRSRVHVHLTSDLNVAAQVGLRHTKRPEDLVILEIDAASAQADYLIIRSTNTTTYLVDYVPPKYITVKPNAQIFSRT